MNKLFPILLVVVLSGCAVGKDNLYGCCFGQSVQGDENRVTVDNIWNSVDGLPLAEKHCQQFNGHAIIVGMAGHTGIYKCLKRSISGNKNFVVLTLYGSEEDALPYAERHCNKYDKSANYRESKKNKVIFDCE